MGNVINPEYPENVWEDSGRFKATFTYSKVRSTGEQHYIELSSNNDRSLYPVTMDNKSLQKFFGGLRKKGFDTNKKFDVVCLREYSECNVKGVGR